MSKWQKIMIGVFCIGVLLCGLGAGVAFTEFSGLSYGGEQIIGSPDMRTDVFDVAFEGREEATVVVGTYPRNGWELTADESVPENTVRFCSTYNAKRIKPQAYWTYWTETGEHIVFDYYWNGGNNDEIAYIMECKDVVLQNLREGKLVSCDVLDMESLTISVNPKTFDKVKVFY